MTAALGLLSPRMHCTTSYERTVDSWQTPYNDNTRVTSQYTTLLDPCDTILPAMTLPEALETTRIHHIAGRTGDRTALVTARPFRASIIPSRLSA
jgi:hypothetical protein